MHQPGRYWVETAWGRGSLDWSELGLARVRLPEPGEAGLRDTREADGRVPREVLRWGEMLQAYFAGEAVDFRPIPLDPAGLPDLEAAIYAALRHVGFGCTTTYGELAARVGHPGAARAVGAAMARNRWPVVVPCHRVLAKDGALGGFSAPGGVRTKRRLLMLEGVTVDDGMPLLPGLLREG